MFSQWKIISIIEIAYYLAIIIASVYPTIKLVSNKQSSTNPATQLKPFMVRYWILLGSKFVGGILLVPFIKQLNLEIENNGDTSADTNLLIASLVLNSISLGFISILNLFVIQYIDRLQIYQLEGPSESQTSTRFPGKSIIKLVLPIDALIELSKGHKEYGFSLLLSKLTFFAVIINIVASSRIADSSTVAYRQTTKSLLIAGSILYISSLALIILYVIYKTFFESRARFTGAYSAYFRKLLTLNLLICPFLLIRMIYNVCSAFAFNVNGSFTVNPSRFTYLFGDWKIYVGMLFVMEIICVFWICSILWVIFFNVGSNGVFDDGESVQKENF